MAAASGILCILPTMREALARHRRKFGSLAAEYIAADIERAAEVRIEAAAEKGSAAEPAPVLELPR